MRKSTPKITNEQNKKRMAKEQKRKKRRENLNQMFAHTSIKERQIHRLRYFQTQAMKKNAQNERLAQEAKTKKAGAPSK